MSGKTSFVLLLSLAVIGCNASPSPTQPTLASSATMAGGAARARQSLGNSDNARRCLDFLNQTRADGTHFRNAGECVKYGAQGGTYGGISNGGRIVYTLTASDTVIGSFSWSLATNGFIQTTTSFTNFLSTSSSASCTISSVTINDPLSANPFPETFFSPNCPGAGGLVYSEVAQTFWNAGPFSNVGVYVPDGVATPVWTLTISQQ